jgi:hypothetical protein
VHAGRLFVDDVDVAPLCALPPAPRLTFSNAFALTVKSPGFRSSDCDEGTAALGPVRDGRSRSDTGCLCVKTSNKEFVKHDYSGKRTEHNDDSISRHARRSGKRGSMSGMAMTRPHRRAGHIDLFESRLIAAAKLTLHTDYILRILIDSGFVIDVYRRMTSRTF